MMDSVGSILKEAREAKAMALADISGITHVRKDYLQALEDGNYDALPENIYAKNFLRLYAQAVGLEDTELLERFKQERGDTSPKLQDRMTATTAGVRDDRGIGAWLPAFLLVAIVAVLSIWLVNRFLLNPAPSQPVTTEAQATDTTTTDATSPEGSATPVEALDATAETSDTSVTEAISTETSPETSTDSATTIAGANVSLSIITNPPGAEVSLDDYSFPGTSPILDAPITASESRTLQINLNGYEPYEETLALTQDLSLTINLTPQSATATSEAAENATPISSDNQLALSVQEATWVEVYQGSARGEGERLIYTTLNPGDAFVFDLPVYVHVGNAGGVSIALNTQAATPMGSSGEVIGRAFSTSLPETPTPETPNSSPDTQGTAPND